MKSEGSSYEQIASEYYDRVRHPTCANFREGSARLLGGWLRKYRRPNDVIWEVGAGKSLLAELLIAFGEGLQNVTISDPSPSMLKFSAKWVDRGARLELSEAEALPLKSGSLGSVVASLGDPYNQRAFWDEAFRVLRPGGRVFFTTPAYDWAVAFRSKNRHREILTAEFELKDGQRIFVPSWIYPTERQTQLIRSSRLEIEEIAQVRRSTLDSESLSPKLFANGLNDLNVVTGYLCRKARNKRS